MKSSVLWGLVGALSFLVLVQGYELLGGQRVGATVKLAVAVLVAIGATALTYGVEMRLDENRRV